MSDIDKYNEMINQRDDVEMLLDNVLLPLHRTARSRHVFKRYAVDGGRKQKLQDVAYSSRLLSIIHSAGQLLHQDGRKGFRVGRVLDSRRWHWRSAALLKS